METFLGDMECISDLRRHQSLRSTMPVLWSQLCAGTAFWLYRK